MVNTVELKAGKAATKSKSIQGNLIALVGVVASYLELAGKLPLGGASLVVTAAGAAWSLLGALTRKVKITSLL